MANAKQKVKLTKSLIAGLEPRDTEYAIWDTECDSFHVRILPSGTKTFNVFYRKNGRTQSRRSLGSVKATTVDQARKNAQAVLADSRRGFDHFSERDKAKLIPTLSEFWTDYLEQHAIPKKAARSVIEDRSLWKHHIEKHFGTLPVSEITRQHIRSWHAKKSHQKASANRALSLLSKMMSLCVENDFVGSNPCTGLQRYAETAKERYLTSDEVRRLLIALSRERDVGGSTMIALLLLTGGRRGEALKAEWREFDLDRGTWDVPAEHVKGGIRLGLKVCRPLSDRALELMRTWRLRSGRSEGFVFPRVTDAERSRYDVKSVWERVCHHAELPGLRLHDLRHTFASTALEHGSSLDQIGRVLGHRNAQTTRRYAHLSQQASADVANRVGNAIDRAQYG